jgi:hypothetical protein
MTSQLLQPLQQASWLCPAAMYTEPACMRFVCNRMAIIHFPGITAGVLTKHSSSCMLFAGSANVTMDAPPPVIEWA